MTTRSLVDSNIFVYAFDQSSPFSLTAKQVIEEISENQRPSTSIQNIAEFCRVVTEKLPVKMKTEEAQKEAKRIGQMFNVLFYNTETVIDALNISKFHNVHFFDALIVATMKQHQIDMIITANESDFNKIPGIKVVNPFKRK